jgi:hypothetical protein
MRLETLLHCDHHRALTAGWVVGSELSVAVTKGY